ncbi:MAG TPA: GAF domain-containing SpoIIE family protein phosphatase [Mycobacteriales bacterium]|nr:GAF domain-containing SpoIIE family protein phosphatase [Mycobacteriales bacterium]
MSDLDELPTGGAPPRTAVAQTFAGIVRELQSDGSAQEILQRIVDLAPRLIAPCEHAGITMVVKREVTTPAASGPVPRAVDQIQYAANQGPCLDALRKHAVFVTEDLAAEERWPQFAARAAAETGIRSMLSFRLFVDEDTLGSLNLYASHPAAFGAEETATGGIFAAHAAVALVTAQQRDRADELADELANSEERVSSLREQATVAAVLQRSMLTVLPPVDGLQLAARYQPAGSGSQVGGDWYDAFSLPDGSTALVIGDVSGHDIGAAVQMAQLRNMLRAIAFDQPGTPGDVLHRLDRITTALEVADAATCVFALLDQPTDSPPGQWRMRFANAGHPPPLLITAAGAELLETDAHLLLGLGDVGARADRSVEVPAGATLLFYTDGLVEHRDRSLDDGIGRLARVAERLATLPIEEFCDVLLAELHPASDDDVSLLAVRSRPLH